MEGDLTYSTRVAPPQAESLKGPRSLQASYLQLFPIAWTGGIDPKSTFDVTL